MDPQDDSMNPMTDAEVDMTMDSNEAPATEVDVNELESESDEGVEEVA